MLEIEKLEKEWRSYKIKRFKPLLFISLGIVLAVTIYLALPILNISRGPVPVSEKVEATTVSKKEKTSLNVERTTATLSKKPAQKQSTMTLTPETDFLHTFETKTSHSSIPTKPKHQSPIHEEKITSKSPTSIKTEHSQQRNAVETEKTKSSIIIKSKTSNNTLQYLIERFNERRDPKLAAYIAQSFYKKKDYNESIKWSIMANSLDPSNEESWLLYAKSKVQIGKKKDAIRALKTYLNQYSSPRVKAYLHNLEHSL